nr:SCO6880 family protein [Bifidobacterium saguini]
MSLLAWTYVWFTWRSRLREGSNVWSSSPLETGRTVGVLGVWSQVEDRAQVVEGESVDVVGTPWRDACYLYDPDKRQATAVLTLKVEEWSLSTNARKRDRAMALNNLTMTLASTPGVVELKETSLLMPTSAPVPPDLDDPDMPSWARGDLAELWAMPEIATPLANVSWVSVSVNVDRLSTRSRNMDRLTERNRVGVLLGDIVQNVVAPALVECGGQHGSIRWCSVDELRDMIRCVSDPAHASSQRKVRRGEPTLSYCEESADGEYVTLESCVARSWWVTQWPDRPVPAGWTRDILQGDRMIALTHIWRPLSMAESEKDLANKQSSMLQRSRLADQKRLSRDERRERREQAQREAEQDANWPDTDHQGYITLFAPDKSRLDDLERGLRMETGKYHLTLNGLTGQQRKALATVLPLGV